MKTSGYVRLLALASFAMAPIAAFSQDTNTTQACVDAFVTQNFPGQETIVKVDRERSLGLPLQLNRSIARVQLKAASLESGAVLASATCTEKKGVITLTAAYVAPTAVIAAR
jgi:hypothetical protein